MCQAKKCDSVIGQVNVTLRNGAGVELKRNTVFIKRYNVRKDVTNGDEDQVVQAGSAVLVD